jgi:hypothetical protein
VRKKVVKTKGRRGDNEKDRKVGLTTGGGPCNPSIEAGRIDLMTDGITPRNNHGQRGKSNNHGQRGKSTIYFTGL